MVADDRVLEVVADPMLPTLTTPVLIPIPMLTSTPYCDFKRSLFSASAFIIAIAAMQQL